MKKLVLLLIMVCLWGCSQQKEVNLETGNQEKFSQLMEDIKITMPISVYDELKAKEVYKEIDDTYLISNDKDNPTLRLDFLYHNNKLVQYVSKEYGFVDAMTDEKINEVQAKELVQLFAKTFLEADVTLTKTTPLSGYETDNYITFEDQNQNTYLVQLNKNMVIKYSSYTS